MNVLYFIIDKIKILYQMPNVYTIDEKENIKLMTGLYNWNKVSWPYVMRCCGDQLHIMMKKEET